MGLGGGMCWSRKQPADPLRKNNQTLNGYLRGREDILISNEKSYMSREDGDAVNVTRGQKKENEITFWR